GASTRGASTTTAGALAFASGAANNGWRLKGFGPRGTAPSENFRSREYTVDATLRPKLVIVYTVPSGPG
ncbi:MAG: hypothetical protein AAB263_05770, partial [Planctomycetota bacterium]